MPTPTKRHYLKTSADGTRHKVVTLKDGVDPTEYMNAMREKGISVKPCAKPPSLRTLEHYSMDGVAKAVDGCKVEPDGTCQHGSPSWLLALGYI